MRNIITNLKNSFFRDWDPNSISGLGDWESDGFEVSPAATNARQSRGKPHYSLPLAERLNQVRTDLEAFDNSLPDLNKLS